MDPRATILFFGLSTFPAYVAYREGASDGKFRIIWATLEISVLLILMTEIVILGDSLGWGPYGYAVLMLLCYGRLFRLRNSPQVQMPLSAVAWVVGIAVAMGIVFFYVSLNRYTFIRGNGEYRVQVYDRFTGQRHD